MDAGVPDARSVYRLGELTLWRRKVPRARQQFAMGGARANPLVVDDVVVALMLHPPAVVAYGRSSGARRWRHELADHPHAGSATAADGVFFAQTTRRLFALEARSGRTVWSRPLGKRLWTSDSAPTVAGGRLFIGDRAGVFWCLDARSGKTLWSVLADPAEKTPVNGVASAQGETVVVPTVAGFAVAYEAASGREVWRRPLDGPSAAEPARLGAALAVPTRQSVYLLDPGDGRVVGHRRWEERRVRAWAACGDVLLVALRDPRPAARDEPVALVGLRDGQILYERPAAPWLVGLRHGAETGLAYETNGRGLGVLDPSTGERLCWLVSAEGPVHVGCSMPDVRDGVIHLLTEDGRLHALRHPAADAAGWPPPRRAGTSPRRPPERPAVPPWEGTLPPGLTGAARAIYGASPGGRALLSLGQDEARELGHARIGTEHLLLAILRYGYGAAAVLNELGAGHAAARAAVEELVGRGPGAADRPLRLSRRAGRVLRGALARAERWDRRFFGADDLQLGLVADPGCTAAAVLWRLEVGLEAVRLLVQRRGLLWWLAAGSGPLADDALLDAEFTQLTDAVRRVLRAAKSAALRQPPHAVAVGQLLGAMLGEGAASGFLREAGADPEDLRRRLAERAASAPGRWPGCHGTASELSVLPRVQHVLHRAVAAARGRGRAVVGIEDLLLGLVDEDRSDGRIARRATVPGAEPDQGPLKLLGVDADRLEAAIRGRG